MQQLCLTCRYFSSFKELKELIPPKTEVEFANGDVLSYDEKTNTYTFDNDIQICSFTDYDQMIDYLFAEAILIDYRVGNDGVELFYIPDLTKEVYKAIDAVTVDAEGLHDIIIKIVKKYIFE